jgi:hypothetical protein
VVWRVALGIAVLRCYYRHLPNYLSTPPKGSITNSLLISVSSGQLSLFYSKSSALRATIGEDVGPLMCNREWIVGSCTVPESTGGSHAISVGKVSTIKLP